MIMIPHANVKRRLRTNNLTEDLQRNLSRDAYLIDGQFDTKVALGPMQSLAIALPTG